MYTDPLGPALNIKKDALRGAQGEVRTLHPRSQAAYYAGCGTRRGRAEMRGVYPKITPLLPFGLRTGRSTLKPKLVRARGQAHYPSRRASSGDTPPPRATETAGCGGRVKNQRPLRRTQDQAPSGPAQGWVSRKGVPQGHTRTTYRPLWDRRQERPGPTAHILRPPAAGEAGVA